MQWLPSDNIMHFIWNEIHNLLIPSFYNVRLKKKKNYLFIHSHNANNLYVNIFHKNKLIPYDGESLDCNYLLHYEL